MKKGKTKIRSYDKHLVVVTPKDPLGVLDPLLKTLVYSLLFFLFISGHGCLIDKEK